MTCISNVHVLTEKLKEVCLSICKRKRRQGQGQQEYQENTQLSSLYVYKRIPWAEKQLKDGTSEWNREREIGSWYLLKSWDATRAAMLILREPKAIPNRW